MKTLLRLRLLAVPMALAALTFLAPPASADHAWGSFHWARTSNPFTLKLGDNLSSGWKPYLAQASADWNQSDVLQTTVVAGQASAKRCPATLGRVEVCNSTYGRTQWLGIAQVWASGSHITQGIVKLNDTYFNSAPYNTPAYRAFVMCQEVGHTFGLDHQDENFTNANLGSCMDYTNNPSTNMHPNAHDFEQLEAIYNHVDGTTTVASSTGSGGSGSAGADHRQDEWGQAVRFTHDGRPILFVRTVGQDVKLLTWVTWAV